MPSTQFTARDGTTVFISAGKKDPSFMSTLELQRTQEACDFPDVLTNPAHISLSLTEAVPPTDAVASNFPNTHHTPLYFLNETTSKSFGRALKIGVVFCGRQTPGGLNVLCGLHDHLQELNSHSSLYGFVGGTAGLFSGNAIVITKDVLSLFRNQGGYNLIGRAADKISEAEMDNAAQTCESMGLDGLVLVGSVYTNTDAAHLSESFSAMGVKTRVVGVSADESRDLKSKLVETTLGFDTVSRTYSQLIGNLCTDCLSAKKYYYFVRLPGRHSDYTALECALQTHPNLVLLSEDVKRNHLSLLGIISMIADLIVRRSSLQKKDYGVILLPEGLIEAISEMRHLIEEMNSLLKKGDSEADMKEHLSPWNRALYESLPAAIQQQLLISRESRGNIQLTQISSEKLIGELVKKELAQRKQQGRYDGVFTPVSFFLGYRARSALPSVFDCNLGYSLGRGSVALIAQGVTGCLANVYNLTKPVAEWKVAGLPLVNLMSPQLSKDGRAYIPTKSLDTSEAPYQQFLLQSPSWMLDDQYINPGPIQFHGHASGANTVCLKLEAHNYLESICNLREGIQDLLEECKPGCSQALLRVVGANMESLERIATALEEED